MKKVVFIFVTAITLFACSEKESVDSKSTLLELTIPVNKFESVKMSDIISEYEIVPLEFTNNSMIYAINKIIIHDGLIYALDSFGSQSVLVFDMKGKFIRSISHEGRGPGEMDYPMDFIIVPEEKRVDILSYKQVNSFSLEGKFIKKTVYDFSSTNFTRLGNTYYFIAPILKQCLLYRTDEKLNFKGVSLTHKKKDESGVNVHCPFSQTDPGYSTYWTLAHDTIYRLEEKKSYPYRAINFGKYAYNHDDYASLSSEKRARLMMFNDNKIGQCLLNVYFETDDYIHIKYQIKGEKFTYILNKNTGKSLHFDPEHLTDDITGLNLPVKFLGLIGCNKERFYLSVSPYRYKSTEPLLKFMNGSSNKKKYTIDDIEKLSNNPIVLIAKYDF